MPAKNALKIYVAGGFYHVYNRGVEKRKVFMEQVDYKVFLRYLKIYLSPKKELMRELRDTPSLINLAKQELFQLISMNNFYKRIDLLSYNLLPNHFHLLVRQKEKTDIEFFMRSLGTKYVVYFNKKYHRVGTLFQGVYKAVLVETEEQLLHLSRYIHLNHQEILKKGESLVSYPWSSYPAYVKNWQTKWLVKDFLLSYFKQAGGFGFNSYQGFVEGYQQNWQVEEKYKALLLE